MWSIYIGAKQCVCCAGINSYVYSREFLLENVYMKSYWIDTKNKSKKEADMVFRVESMRFSIKYES